MNSKEVTQVKHVWCESDDRWVYIEYNSINKIIGLNFMQGDDYDDFKRQWCLNNASLFEFWEEMLYTFPIERASVNTLEFINKVMWAYHSAISKEEQYGR